MRRESTIGGREHLAVHVRFEREQIVFLENPLAHQEKPELRHRVPLRFRVPAGSRLVKLLVVRK